MITDVVSVLRRLLDKLIPYPRVGYTDHDIMVPGYLVDLCYQNIGKGASKYQTRVHYRSDKKHTEFIIAN